MKYCYFLFFYFLIGQTIAQEKIEDKLFSPDELEYDLNYLFEQLEQIHPNLYHNISAEEINQRRKAVLQNLIESTTRTTFAKQVIPIISSLNDGHTKLLFPREERRTYLDEGGLLFPFSVSIHNEKVYVKWNLSSDKNIPHGAEITAINGINSQDLLNEMRKFKSAELTHFKDYLIARDFRRLLWYLFDFNDKYKLALMYDGKKVNKTIKGITLDEFNEMVESKNLQKNDEPYNFRLIEDQSIAVIDFKSMSNRKNFKAFLDTSFKIIDQNNIEHLVIDIRENGGGDSRLADLLFDYISDQPYKMAEEVEIKASKTTKQNIRKKHLKWYLYPIAYPAALFFKQAHPYFYTKNGKTVTIKQKKLTKPKKVKQKFNGDSYLLTSNYTFSSANMLAIGFKCYQMGTIVGEETGEPLRAFGDITTFNLPNTNLQVYCSHKKFLHPCYENDHQGVLPDVEVIPSVEDIHQRQDVVMERTISIIKERKAGANN